MAIAELFIGAFITVLLEKLASADLIKLAKSAGISSELDKWSNNLTLIQLVLADAEQRQITNERVQFWLNKLQHLAYEIDDVLDDLATKAMRSRVKQECSTSTSKRSKVLKFIPTKFHALKYGHKMSSRLDGITAKLNVLEEEKKRLGLNDNVVERSHRPIKRLEQTSLIDESKIIGREGDKEALLETLLEEASLVDESSSSHTQNVSVLSIVGLGGIGKTTLARLLYNDKKVKGHFELMSWVCISDDFDVFTISKAIFKDVGGDDRKFETLNQLQQALAEKLSKKRFLLVLDDVWNENYSKWELLQLPFNVGAIGSKILVTTRKTKVESVMDSVQSYPLELLSQEEALSLFAQNASGKQNFDVNQTLKLHGEDIVKRCGSLPLALRTLGRVFRTKSDHEEWEELLNSEIWNSRNGSEILPALRLSYYDLPLHLKQMFGYCCLFPKDYLFDKDDLVLLWMAEGFLSESKGKKSMESFGRECFEELVSRSFFQHSNNDKSLYTMHDLMNDLAKSVAGEFFCLLYDKMDVDSKNEALEKSHHVSFIRENYEVYKKFKALERARRMRTFLVMSVTRLNAWEQFYLSHIILIELLPQLHFLRVLSLARYTIKEVPESIGSLKHLRYLNFSNTNITCLPKQVGDLHNLQSLLLSGCADLSSLPDSIVRLIHLRHLDIYDTPQLNKMPLGIGRLTSLQTLSKVFIGEACEFNISDLNGLLHLQGQLCIHSMHKVKNAEHAKEANLQQKKGICDLQLKWSDVFDGSRNKLTEYEVLEGLRPFEKLRSLKILNYNGTKFPSWVGDRAFDCLTQIALTGCRSCKSLPTLGHLQSLQKLCVESMHELDRVDFEFLGHSNSRDGNTFPALEVLEFKDMPNWKKWSTSYGEKNGTFPCLREISLVDCPKLDVVVVDSMMSLRALHVSRCSVAVLKSMVGVSSSLDKLEMHHIQGLTQLHGELLEHLRAVEYLNISACDELTYLLESKVAACEILKSLQKLEISGCLELVSIGEEEVHLKSSMESVTEVSIQNCKRLKSYICPHKIEKLLIRSCPLVTITDVLPSTLKFIDISNCGNLEVRRPLINNFSSLESLNISRMPNIKLFPSGCLSYVTKLTIRECANIESIPDNGYGFLPFLCLRSLEISRCRSLKSFPYEQLQNLTSMEEMVISYCPSLDDSFPCGVWPPNLSYLRIGELKKPILEWGLLNFPTSLVTLELYGGNSGVVSFAAKGEGDMSGSLSSFLLPSSLTRLWLWEFKELESVLGGLQHLACLQHLYIKNCPKVRDLPKTLLPSLSSLWVSGKCSLELKKKCRRNRKGKYWPIISQIPNLRLCLD